MLVPRLISERSSANFSKHGHHGGDHKTMVTAVIVAIEATMGAMLDATMVVVMSLMWLQQ
jgi:hypothetical protein